MEALTGWVVLALKGLSSAEGGL